MYNQMKIKIKANSIYKRLQIWNGIFNLTKKELEVISAFIKVNTAANDVNLCSKSNKDKVAKILNFEAASSIDKSSIIFLFDVFLLFSLISIFQISTG